MRAAHPEPTTHANDVPFLFVATTATGSTRSLSTICPAVTATVVAAVGTAVGKRLLEKTDGKAVVRKAY